MRHFLACLSLLGLSACDTIWAWTARCEANDPACAATSSTADMAMAPIPEDLAAVDQAGVDQAGADMTGYPGFDLRSSSLDMGAPPFDLNIVDSGGPLTDLRQTDSDMTVVVVVKVKSEPAKGTNTERPVGLRVTTH